MYPKFKAVAEWLLALILVVPALCLSLITAIGVFVVLRDVPFVVQKRVGKNGKVFTVLKVKTMYSNSKEIANYLGMRNGDKSKNDPRVFPLGKWIRRCSLDELLQIVNILFCQMSFVGPRPFQPDELLAISEKYKKLLDARHSVLPGLTGLPQIYGRSELRLSEKLMLDCVYALSRTFKMELMIWSKTPKAVISGKGAF